MASSVPLTVTQLEDIMEDAQSAMFNSKYIVTFYDSDGKYLGTAGEVVWISGELAFYGIKFDERLNDAK